MHTRVASVQITRVRHVGDAWLRPEGGRRRDEGLGSRPLAHPRFKHLSDAEQPHKLEKATIDASGRRGRSRSLPQIVRILTGRVGSERANASFCSGRFGTNVSLGFQQLLVASAEIFKNSTTTLFCWRISAIHSSEVNKDECVAGFNEGFLNAKPPHAACEG